MGPHAHPHNPYLTSTSGNHSPSVVAPSLPNPFSLPFGLRKQLDLPLRFPPHVLHPGYFPSAHYLRGAPPLLPPSVGLFPSSSSYQTLLANFSAAQQQSAKLPPPEFSASPPLSPRAPPPGASPPEVDRRSSSIAALRLKAREHELRLEMMRQNGDLIS